MDILLPVCITLALLALIIGVILWTRGRHGRAVQALGFAVLPVGLYLTGLLDLVWDAVVALSRWGAALVFYPIVGIGMSLLGLAVVLWVAGGLVAKRTRGRRSVEKAPAQAAVTRRTPAQQRPSQPATTQPTAEQKSADGDLDDIEAILRKHGIE